MTDAQAHRGHQQSTSWAEARRASFEAGCALPAQRVSLYEATGRELAGDVAALHDIPHFASSAMDGWAVSGEAPWMIVDGAAGRLTDGEAVPVATGHIVPVGTRGILRSESGEVAGGYLVRGPRAAPDEPTAGQHVRTIGEEAEKGEIVVRAGTTLNPAHIALIAGCGHDLVEVLPEPRVAFVFTGDEVVTSGLPAPGWVRDSFGPQLPAFARLLGGRVATTRRIGDDFSATVAALSDDAEASELIITTGGTGHSSADHVRRALEALRAEPIVDGIAMRPGRPTVLARLRDGRFAVALPGNPLAAMMGMLTVVHPLLAALRGAPAPGLDTIATAATLPGRGGTTTLVPYRLADGLALPNPWTGSGMMRGLADAAGVLVVPPEGVPIGESAPVMRLPWRQ